MSNRKKKFDDNLLKKIARLNNKTLPPDLLLDYRLFDNIKRKYPRLKIESVKKNYHWQMDVAFMRDIKGYNYQLQYWLVVVDVYSRFVWVKLMKNKTSTLVMKKFEEILKDPKVEIPTKIQTDEGGEFEKIKKELSPVYGFTVYHTYNREIKASIVEATIKTLKLMVRRTIGVTQNKMYVKAMHLIVDAYNSSPHRGVGGFTPKEVYEGKKKKQLHYLQYKSHFQIPKPTKVVFKPGDQVRVALLRKTFEKSSLQLWGREIFFVYKVFATNPITYELRDAKNEVLKGRFYKEELQRI